MSVLNGLNVRFENDLRAIGVELGVPIDFVETKLMDYFTLSFVYPSTSQDPNGFGLRIARNYEFVRIIHVGSNEFTTLPRVFKQEEMFNLKLLFEGAEGTEIFFDGIEAKDSEEMAEKRNAIIAELTDASMTYIKGMGLMEQTMMAGAQAPADGGANAVIRKNERKARRRMERAKAVFANYEVDAQSSKDGLAYSPVSVYSDDAQAMAFFNKFNAKEEKAAMAEKAIPVAAPAPSGNSFPNPAA